MSKFILPSLFFAVATLLSANTSAAPMPWLKELSHQLAHEKKCDVMFYLRTKDVKGDGQGYVEARAQCVDGRQFDAKRNKPTDVFSITECSSVICKNENTPPKV